MQTLDENIISEIQKIINIKEENIAKLEEESFSQILLILKETNSKYRPIFSELKSRLTDEEATNDEYKRIIEEKKAFINAKLKEIVDDRDNQIKEIQKELKILHKDLDLLR